MEMCNIISGILLGSWMIWFSSFHHTTNCDAFVVFSRDAPIGAFLLALSFLLRSLSFFLICLLSSPRQHAFSIVQLPLGHGVGI